MAFSGFGTGGGILTVLVRMQTLRLSRFGGLHAVSDVDL